jgi:hypothetical protein
VKISSVRLTLGLRSPLAFLLPGAAPDDPPAAAGIDFEGREFVWHPPQDYTHELGDRHYGPMVAAVVTGDADYRAAADSLQRLLSAIAFHYGQPVDDGGVGLGGDGDPDAYSPGGPRLARADPYVIHEAAPAAIRIQTSDLADDPKVILDSFKSLRTEIEELSSILDEAERREPQFPHRRRQLRLLHSLGRRLLQAHLDWLEEVEQEFGGPTETIRA